MGNRAVITTKRDLETEGVGVYVHWNGGANSVRAFLKYCKKKQYRTPDTDCYGYARLAQVIGNYFGGSTSVGVDRLDRLDQDNYDNGVYIIEGWEIVGRKYQRRADELVDEEYINEMLKEIDEQQPVKEQLGDKLYED